MQLIPMHTIPASGKTDNYLGPVFRPFTNRDQYSFQMFLCQVILDITAIYYIPITDTTLELSVFWPSDTESRIKELRFF